MQEIKLGDSLTIAVRQNGLFKKVLKLSYSKHHADFYIMLPYLKASEYRCGIGEMKENVDSINLDTRVNSKTSGIPVKFTYHESGQVHFKPVNPSRSSSPYMKLAEINSIPINQLNGEHIFTVLLEGLDAFEDAKYTYKKGETIVELSAPDEAEHFKLVGYAGFGEQSILNKYGPDKLPDIIVKFTRPHLSQPLYLGIYAIGGTSILNTGNRHFIMTLTGFEVKGKNIRMLFLDASTP